MTTIAATLERRMVDRCRITTDPQGLGDDVLDEDTLQLVAPDSDTTVIYQGRCLVGSDTDRTRGAEERSGQTLTLDRVLVRIPTDAAASVRAGDQVEILAAPGDTRLVGRAFTVADIHLGGMASSRILYCAARARTREP